jgi:mono/diheme cytochrome c family protein
LPLRGTLARSRWRRPSRFSGNRLRGTTCHGADLEGQPDWKRRLDNGRMPAPPHDESGHTWHHADRALFQITKGGVGSIVPGYDSDMPAFEGVMSDAEIAAVLAFIKSAWPERQRAFQAEVTANDGGGS